MGKESRDLRLLTADQYARLDDDGNYRTELERGRLIREPRPGEIHGTLVIRMGHYLFEFVEQHGLGRVMADIGVITERDPDTVRGPDLAFTSHARMNVYPQPGFLGSAPDLCVEILSPSNRASRMLQKVVEYLDAGARLVWVIDPIRKSATEYRSKSDIRILGLNDSLEGYDVLPGFELPLSRLFAL
ncbi:MAG: Uma2 family endonuclease [Longimicrobiales bacterium]